MFHARPSPSHFKGLYGRNLPSSGVILSATRLHFLFVKDNGVLMTWYA